VNYQITPAPSPDPSSRLGLALSSGAARGAAHVGALLALEERGLAPDVVVGTSAGALVGGAYAAGLTPAALAERATTTGWSDFGHPRPTRRLALIETTALEANLRAVFRRRRIEDLPRTFGAVATDLRTRRAVLLATGDASRAVRASIAVPGVFPPVRVGDEVLVDGVLVSPLPVWAARRLGADRTIGIRLRPQAPAGRRESVQRRVLLPALEVRPDLEIVIDTTGFSSWSARDVTRLIDLGYAATHEALAAADLDALRGSRDGTARRPAVEAGSRAAG
jgi:NTE family protein